MNTKKHSQIKTEELLEVIQSRHGSINQNDAVVSAVFTKGSDGSWRFLIGKCELQRDVDELEEIYTDIAFCRKIIKSFELEAFLVQLDSSGYKISDSLPAIKNDRDDSRWNEEIIPSNFTKSRFPVRKYSARISQNAEFREDALLGYGLPYHSSSSKYLKKFMGLPVYHGHSHGDNGELSFLASDLRGAVVFDGEKLSIQGSQKDIFLVGELVSGKKVVIEAGRDLNVSEQEILNSELWLITKDNEILDFRSLAHGQYGLSQFNDDKKNSENLITLIESGEGHHLEFKVYINLKNKKAGEIEKTICAFSNAKGGSLIIGVDYEGNIIGVDDMVCGAYEGTLGQSLGAYVRDIRSRVRETLRYGQCFDIEPIKLGKKYVVLITVERTEKTNYYLNAGVDCSFVRKGAISKKMKSNEDREPDSQPNSIFNWSN